MSHRVPSTFKLVDGHLNSIFFTGNFAWAFAIHFPNNGQKDFAKFEIFNRCTVCGKTLRDSGGGYLPAFWAMGPHCYKGCVAQKAGNKGVWPKTQVNNPLQNPSAFCRTLCRGQKFEILLNPFAHCLQSVWGRPMQNYRSKNAV